MKVILLNILVLLLIFGCIYRFYWVKKKIFENLTVDDSIFYTSSYKYTCLEKIESEKIIAVETDEEGNTIAFYTESGDKFTLWDFVRDRFMIIYDY